MYDYVTKENNTSKTNNATRGNESEGAGERKKFK